MACSPFFSRAGTVRMNLDDGAVHRHRFDLDTDDLLFLQGREHTIQDPCLGPTVHSCVDRMPIAESLGQSPPFAAVFGHVQDGVQHLKVGETDVASLFREAPFDTPVLGLCDFHGPIYYPVHCVNGP